MIADTSFIIDLLRNRSKEAVNKVKELEAKSEPIFLTSVTVFELWHGAIIASDYKTEAYRVSEMISGSHVLFLDTRSAKMAGIISGSLHRNGLRIEPEDCMIAGIAKANNQKIITRNFRDFGRIRGVEIEAY